MYFLPHSVLAVAMVCSELVCARALHQQPARIAARKLVYTTQTVVMYNTVYQTAGVVQTNSASVTAVTQVVTAVAASSSSSTASVPELTTTVTFAIPSTTTIQIALASPKTSAASAMSSSQIKSASISSAVSSNPSLVTPFLRGVNLGGWLVIEKWMTPGLFSGAFSNAIDQYTFDQISGAEAALHAHWDTFFTQSDIQAIASTGINALRIPIGFWAYDNAGTSYVSGADAYLEKAISWARQSNLKVWIDLHGSPGSQNGFDNSGKQGPVEWQRGDNLKRSITVLQTMAAKYGAAAYADVVVGLELVNEPISWGNNDFGKTKQWAQDAYAAIKSSIVSPNMVVVMHDAFMGAPAWIDTAKSINANGRFGVDTHLYELFTDAKDSLTQAQHIAAACAWSKDLKTAKAIMPTYVGEWSPATNICAYPDGSTTAGTTCSVDTCQCQANVAIEDWNPPMVAQVRKFVEAQLDTFESSSSGYFMWSAKAPGAWGFLNGIQRGSIPNPVTSRMYPGQC